MRIRETYIFSFNFLTTDSLHHVVKLMLGAKVGVGKDLLIEGSGVCDNTSNVYTDVSGISPGTRHVTVASNGSVVEKKVTVDATEG
jgi:hypothetical protein